MPKVKIVYCSITGNDEEIADVLDEKFQELGCEVDVSEMGQTDTSDFLDNDICVIATYTYEDGIVPEEALDFYEDLQEEDLSGKIYGVCGSGDHYYDDYCRAIYEFGKVFDKIGAVSGANPVEVELAPEEEDINNLDNFAEELFTKFQNQ
ncbi:flavodoxin [Companilactobacillus sp. DQM5]|uniref:flavodoxin n=1 Tax=Companilactobacillus sp. DQM5 TaxID=3463359 RepID=UPI0040593849